MLMKKKLQYSFALLFFLCFCSSCFDYKERLYLNADFSGKVQITYTVPVSEKKRESLVSFLPVSKEQIQEAYEQFLEQGQAQLKSLDIDIIPELVEKGTNDAAAAPKSSNIRVSYELVFQDPKILEHLPLDNTQVFRTRKQIQIRRVFKALSSTNKAKKNFVSRIRSYIMNKFAKHSLSYTTHFPQGFRFASKLGQQSKKGFHTYHIASSRLLDAKKNTEWLLIIQK